MILVRLVSNAQTNNIKGIISTAQSHAKAQVNDIGFKNSFYVDGEPTISEDESNRAKIKVVNRDNWHMWKKLKFEKLSAKCIKGKKSRVNELNQFR